MENPFGETGFIPVTVTAKLEVGFGGVVEVELPVMPDDATSEFIKETADSLALADVGVGQPVGNDTTDVVFVFAKDHGSAQPCRRDRSGDAARRGAVDGNSGLLAS